MNQIVSSQAALFLTSVQIGILMGVLFDLIRIVRKMIKHPNFFVQIEDILYWISCSLIGFYMLYICNYADIRPYIFIGMILGGVFYFSTFSIIFMKIATLVIEYVKGLIRKLIALIRIPIKWFIHLISIPLHYLGIQWVETKYKSKVKVRKIKRIQYEKKSDHEADKYLKKGRT